MDRQDDLPLTIRSFQKGDAAACHTLYSEGLLGGSLAENDTGLDIDDIQSAYMANPGGHFWVAEALESLGIVGMIGVQQHEPGVGEIRRLRVQQDKRRRGIGRRLVETAVQFCHERNYLKITLDTHIGRTPAIKLFERFHFKHDRTRSVNGKDLLYFYMDLYGREKQA